MDAVTSDVCAMSSTSMATALSDACSAFFWRIMFKVLFEFCWLRFELFECFLVVFGGHAVSPIFVPKVACVKVIASCLVMRCLVGMFAVLLLLRLILNPPRWRVTATSRPIMPMVIS